MEQTHQITQTRKEGAEHSEPHHPPALTTVIECVREQVTLPLLWSIFGRELHQLPTQLTTTTTTTCESADIGERSHQTPSTPLIDLARPGCSKWMVIGQRRQTKSQESRATGSTTKYQQQDGLIALQAHPELLNSIPPEHTLFLFHVNEPERQLAFINQHMPPLVSKLDSTDTLLLYQQFLNNYATPMNQIAEMIKECIFVDVKEAILVFDHFLRSFIPGFTLFKGKTTVSKGLKRTIVTCHTTDHKKHSEEASHHQKCKWRAVVQEVVPGEFSYEEISDFHDHQKECVAKYARFTPDEVDFQLSFGAFGRAHIMGYLNQPYVQAGTYRQRINRSVRKVKDLFTNLEVQELSNQEPDFRLTNLSSLTTDLSTVSKEAVELITLITYMVQKKGALAWVVFEKVTPKCITLTEIHLLWKNGAELLKTHSDVIWCDSLWSVSQDGDNLQTIVIMDKHSKLQLTAMCLVVKENTLSWFHFFSWVQYQIPSFKPQCVVTDGAAGIYNAFKQATSTTPCHIVCWWHKAQNRDKKTWQSRVLV